MSKRAGLKISNHFESEQPAHRRLIGLLSLLINRSAIQSSRKFAEKVGKKDCCLPTPKVRLIRVCLYVHSRLHHGGEIDAGILETHNALATLISV